MSTIHLDQFKYTCDRCNRKRVVDAVDTFKETYLGPLIEIPAGWIELEGSLWDKRTHLCEKCVVDLTDFMKNHVAYSGRSKLHAFEEALKAITHVATVDQYNTEDNLAAFKTCQKIAAQVLLENP